jgi:hypothetical protein
MLANLDAMIRWEEGELSNEETTLLFSELVKSGLAWSLQGCYGRQAVALIEGGWLDQDGNILERED